MQEEIVSIGIPIFFQGLSFVIFVFIMRRILYAPLTEFMEKRRGKIDADIRLAKEKKEKALALKEQYEAQLSSARKEAREIITEAHRRGDVIISESRRQARSQGEELLQKAREEIELEKKKAFAGLKNDVALISIGLAEKILQENLNPEIRSRALAASLKKLEDVS